ncbi:hypothetical protein EV368DRAFT_70098 [Lentinula lateritia]|nr:hypothetical protein EV368DRAFT_70098 [Lentinula lateritia]
MESGSHVIPHLPNFSILQDIVGFFMLHNIALLGPVLDYWLYSEYEAATQDITETISSQWAYSHFDISLTGKTTGVAGLRSLMEDWVVTQCKALILHKLNADSEKVKGKTKVITPNWMRKAIEKQMVGLPWFVEKWPKWNNAKNIRSWTKDWSLDNMSYAWPSAPQDSQYVVEKLY